MNPDICQICQSEYSKHLSVIPYKNSIEQSADSSNFQRCHLVCASFIKDVEIKIINKPKNKLKQAKRELVAESSANLKGLEYSQLLCQSCNEIDDNTYVKCIDEECNNYFHISCIIKNDQKVGVGKWSDFDQKVILLEPICTEHQNNEKFRNYHVIWSQVERRLKQKIFELNNLGPYENSEDEGETQVKSSQIRSVCRKESHSLSQEDSSITKLENKQEKKSQRKRQQKLKQQEENSTISNSVADSADNSSEAINNITPFQYANSVPTKSTLKRKGKNAKSESSLSQDKIVQKVAVVEEVVEVKKRGRKKKVIVSEEKVDDVEICKAEVIVPSQQSQQSLSALEKVYKNNTLFKDCYDPTKSKTPEEIIKKTKIKISCGIPQYPNTTDTNRQQLMKQWWKYVNDYFFKESSAKDQQILSEDKLPSILALDDQNGDTNSRQSSSKNYRYEKFILRSQIYQSLIENDYYLNGIIPSLKNDTFLTVLFENDEQNYLIKYDLQSDPLSSDTINNFSSQNQNQQILEDYQNLKIICQSNILSINAVNEAQDSTNLTENSNEYENKQKNYDLSDVLSLYDIQGVDKASLIAAIECSQRVMEKQNEFKQLKDIKNTSHQHSSQNLASVDKDREQNECKNEDGMSEENDESETVRIPNQIEYEIMYWQDQLKSYVEENNSEKKRILDNIQNEQIKYFQIEDLERESRKVFDIVKWNTIIRYMQVGYGEKSEEILLTYIKNENEDEMGEKRGDSDEKTEQNLDLPYSSNEKYKNESMHKSTGGKNSRRNKIFQQICLRNTDGYIEIDCKICFNNYSSESNPVVYCSLCSASFHQFCYGIKEIPHDDFLCDLCLFRQQQIKNEQLAKNQNNSEQIVEAKTEKKKKKKEHRLLCKICMKTGFPMVDVSHQFYHVSCLIFLNMIYIKDSCIALRGGEKDEDIVKFQEDLLNIVVKSEFANHICAICQKKQGYKMKCSHPDCCLSFHTHCAYIDGIHFDISISDEDTSQNKANDSPYSYLAQGKSYTSLDEVPIDANFHKIKTVIYCPYHSPLQNRDEVLQVYLRRYGINLFQTAVEYKDYNSFIADHENVYKQLKQKIEETKIQISQEKALEGEGNNLNKEGNQPNHDADIFAIFGDTFSFDPSFTPFIQSPEINKIETPQTQSTQKKQVTINNQKSKTASTTPTKIISNNNNTIQSTKYKENDQKAINFEKSKVSSSNSKESSSETSKRQQNNTLIISNHHNKQQQQTLHVIQNSKQQKLLAKNIQINTKQQQQQNSQKKIPSNSSSSSSSSQNIKPQSRNLQNNKNKQTSNASALLPQSQNLTQVQIEANKMISDIFSD